ncbi:MAG TPA: low affinity iron permease family protein, partial [Verrucomicrobiae bacterium]|nr:low affinity iron permease family protein [Verrucomicrobiae bacterium]
HLKLDELLRAVSSARTTLVNLENFSDEELDRLQKEFEHVNRLARKRHRLKDSTHAHKEAA